MLIKIMQPPFFKSRKNAQTFKLKMKKDINPSGYSYHVPPAYSFAKSPRDPNLKIIPGPTDYSPIYRYCSPSYTISKSKRYILGIKDQLSSVSITNRSSGNLITQKSFSKSDHPSPPVLNIQGPGYYNPNLSIRIEKSPGFKFSKVPRYPKQRFKTPGPGFYQINTMKRGPSYTISKAREKVNSKFVPGPGDYQIPHTIGIASLKKKT